MELLANTSLARVSLKLAHTRDGLSWGPIAETRFIGPSAPLDRPARADREIL